MMFYENQDQVSISQLIIQIQLLDYSVGNFSLNQENLDFPFLEIINKNGSRKCMAYKL